MSTPHGSQDPKSPVSGRPALGGLVPAGAVPAVRCHATNRRGEQCGRWAIVGGSVCTSHGGASPQARRAADARLLELVSPALVALETHLTDPTVPAAVRQRAIDTVLDRTGHKQPEVHVQVTGEQANAALDAAMAKVMQSRGFEVPELPALEA